MKLAQSMFVQKYNFVMVLTHWCRKLLPVEPSLVQQLIDSLQGFLMNKSIFKSVLATTMVSFFGVAAVSSAANAQSITGAGATFPAPIYAKWAAEYNKATGVKVNYQSVGSGAGIKQIDSKTVDFGASDMPQTDEVLKAKGQFQFPTVIGGTVPVINIKGIAPGQMKLDGQVLGDIYLGKITKWNDAAIKALNPTLALPDADIAPVRRADGSGTTFNFTNYLSRVHAEWKTKVGEGTAVNWPVGAGGKGNEGVAAFVNRLPNSIGYVEYSYVIQNKMTYTQLKNKDGVFVSPSEEAFKAAAAGADWNKSFYQLITDQPGKGTWPISTATFILMHVQQDKPAQATETFKFFTWAFKSGDKLASDLDYVPLPDSVIATIEKSWGLVKDSAGKPVALK
jgi:phosphate transport system substrate-binding protein